MCALQSSVQRTILKIFWTCAFLNFSLSYLSSSSWTLSYHILLYDKIFIYYITSPSNEMHKFKIFSKLCALQSSVQRTILKIFWTCAFLNGPWRDPWSPHAISSLKDVSFIDISFQDTSLKDFIYERQTFERLVFQDISLINIFHNS